MAARASHWPFSKIRRGCQSDRMSEPAQNQGVLLVLCSWFSVQLVLSWLCAVGSAHWCAAPSFSLVAHKSCYSVIRRGQIRVFSHWLRPNQALFSLAEATLPSGRRPAPALSPGCGPGCGPGLSSEPRLWSRAGGHSLHLAGAMRYITHPHTLLFLPLDWKSGGRTYTLFVV